MAQSQRRISREKFWNRYIIAEIISFGISVLVWLSRGADGAEAFVTALGIFLVGPFAGYGGLLGILFFRSMSHRLHDIGRSGKWALLAFVPVIGGIVLLYFFSKEGDVGANQYGEDPKSLEGND